MWWWWTVVFLFATITSGDTTISGASSLVRKQFPFHMRSKRLLPARPIPPIYSAHFHMKPGRFVDEDYDHIVLTINPDSKDFNRNLDITTSVQRCPKEPCSRKCCEFGNGYDVLKQQCVELPDSLKIFTPVLNEKSLINPHIRLLEGNFTCKSDNVSSVTKIPVSNVSDDYNLLLDGNFMVEFPYTVRATPVSVYKLNEFCIDTFINSREATDEGGVFSALICYNETEFNAQLDIKRDSRMHNILCSTCMLVTCFLIVLRVIVFAWLPELRTLHGMILMAYLISFLVGFCLLGTTQFLILMQNINRKLCKFSTYIVYFCLLVAFFWRNIMCFDIWWTFSGKRAVSSHRSSRTQFYRYCMYALSPPALMTILLILFSELPRDYIWLPQVEVQACFLYGYTKLIYFYGPIIILFVVNMVFFLLTALKIIAIKKEIETIIQNKESCKHDLERDTQRFVLYAKLFSIMAFVEINWIFEVISVFFPDAITILHVSDAYNVFVTLIMFISFLCQRDTWRMIKKRYKELFGLSASEAQINITPSDTSSSESEDDLEVYITSL